MSTDDVASNNATASCSLFCKRRAFVGYGTGRSGWWMLVGSVPAIGQFILTIILCLDSEPGTNRYGRYPKD